MITGDHLETALKVAIDAEIITEEESRLEGIYLTGTKFRKEIGEYQKVWNKEKQIFEIKIADKKRFTNVLKRLRIIARANPDDKMILISGIR
jgi:magnesium-transporting ATPase (P-type)